MMLGKRSRHNSVKRTTSLLEFTFDPASVDVHATPADHQIITAGVGNGDGATVVQPSDNQINSSVVCEPEDPWNGTVSELMCPRASGGGGGGGGQFHHQLMNRRHSADFAQSLDVNTKDQIASHFLRDCSLCKRRLVPGRDIYMYRGDRAFCSSECRQQQITQDNKKEKSSLTLKKENISTAVSSSTLPPSSPSSSAPRKHVFAIGEMVTTTATTATTMCSY